MVTLTRSQLSQQTPQSALRVKEQQKQENLQQRQQEEIKKQQEEQQKLEQEQQQIYESQLAEYNKQQKYAEGQRLAYENPGGVYLKGDDPELIRGYMEAKKYIASEQARYGTPEPQPFYASPEYIASHPQEFTMTQISMPTQIQPGIISNVVANRQPVQNIFTKQSTQDIFNKGTYNIQTKTYTSPEGYKQSMTLPNAFKQGAVFEQPKQVMSVAPTTKQQKQFNINVPEILSKTRDITGKTVTTISKVFEQRPTLVGGIKAPVTYGQIAGGGYRTLEYTGETSKKGWEDMLKKFGVKTEETIGEYKVPIYQQGTSMYPSGKSGYLTIPESTQPTYLGMIPSVVGAIPTTAAYIVAPYITTVSAIVSETEKLKGIKQEAKKEAEKQYNLLTPEEKLGITKEEFMVSVTPQLEEQIQQQAYTSITGNIAFLGLVGGSKVAGKVYQKTFKPKLIITEKNIPQPITKNLEQAQPYILPNGKEYIPSQFTMLTYIPSAEVKGYITTPAREFFKLKPKVTFDWIPVTKPKTFIIQPAVSLISKEVKVTAPYVMQVSKVLKSGKFGKTKLYDITDLGSRNIEAGQISTLPKRIQYAYEQLFEKEIVGVPTQAKNIPKLLKQEDILQVGNLQAERLFVLEGKRISLFETVSVSRTLKTSETTGETVSQIFTGFKETTKPLSRATGNIPTIQSIVNVKPAIDLTPKKSFIISPANIKKTPFQITQQQKIEQVSKALIGIPKPKIPSLKIQPSTTSRELPYMISTGGAGLTQLPYAGTGQYEITAGTIRTTSPSITGKDILGLPTNEQLKNSNFELLSLNTNQVTKQITTLKNPQLELTKQPQMELLKQPIIEKQIDMLKTNQIEKQVQKEVQKQTQKERQLQRLKTSQIQKPRIPKIPIPFKFPSQISKLKTFAQKVIGKQAYQTQVRRQGKWFNIGKIEPLGIATKKGAEFAKTTLGASFRLKPEGTTAKEDINYILGKEFAPSKREFGVQVQQRKFRLSARTEVKEIQIAKRKKEVKTKWF